MSIRSFLMTLAFAAVLGGAPAFAQQKANKSDKAAPPRQQMTLEQAVKQVQQKTHGRILAADTIPRGQSRVYRIKVLTPQGHVRVMQLHSDSKTEPKPDRGKQGGH